MKRSRSYAFLSILFIVCSCTGQEVQPPAATKLGEIKTFQAEEDPYFNGTQEVYSDDGPKTITRNIIQDSKGYYWMATWDGIVGYDGNTFTNYTNQLGLRRFRVFTIHEDRQGIIWFGTIGAGIYRYDGKSFQNITVKDGLVSDHVTDIFEDKAGFLWFATTEGMSKYDRLSFTNYMIGDGLTDSDVNTITQDENGRYYIGTRGKAFTFDGEEFEPFTAEGKNFYNIRKMISYNNGNILLGGNGGFWIYKGGELLQVSKNFTGYIYEDSAYNIWTSSENGGPGSWVLTRYDGRSMLLGQPSSTEVISDTNMYFGIMEDRQGNILWGTLRGVFLYDGKETVEL